MDIRMSLLLDEHPSRRPRPIGADAHLFGERARWSCSPPTRLDEYVFAAFAGRSGPVSCWRISKPEELRFPRCASSAAGPRAASPLRFTRSTLDRGRTTRRPPGPRLPAVGPAGHASTDRERGTELTGARRAGFSTNRAIGDRSGRSVLRRSRPPTSRPRDDQARGRGEPALSWWCWPTRAGLLSGCRDPGSYGRGRTRRSGLIATRLHRPCPGNSFPRAPRSSRPRAAAGLRCSGVLDYGPGTRGRPPPAAAARIDCDLQGHAPQRLDLNPFCRQGAAAWFVQVVRLCLDGTGHGTTP